MKNLLSFLLFCFPLTALLAQTKHACRTEIISITETETIFQFTLSGLDFQQVATENGPAVLPVFGGGTPLLEAGSPDVPKWAAAFSIPATGNMEVEITDFSSEEFPGVFVAPSKGNLTRNLDPAAVPFAFGAAYERDEFFPGKFSALQKPFILRGMRGQPLWLFPVQYNPVRKVLRVVKKMTVRVFSSGGTGENELKPNPVLGESRSFSDIYETLFFNFDKSTLARGGSGPVEKMLLVTTEALRDELQPLLLWKRQSGIETEVVTVEEIGSPEPSAIHNVVKDRYLNAGITWLLLVGDGQKIKPEMRLDDGTRYACDNCFGYLAGDDHLPEVLVGRLHAATPAELRIMVNRNLEYEKNPLATGPGANWCARAMAVASNQGAGIGDDNQADWEHANDWKSRHLADGYERFWEFYDGDHAAQSPTPGDPTADRPGNPPTADLVNLLNGDGIGLFNYTGHGYLGACATGNFDLAAVANLRNANHFPLVIGVACAVGDFTSPAGDCLGEALQRAGDAATGQPFGAIACFFSSTFQSWAPPMEGQDGMNQFLIDADGLDKTPTFGSLLAVGNAKMIVAYGAGGEAMADFWNPFAEPSTMPRTRLPQKISAAHAPGLFIGATSLTVNCPTEGALAAAFFENRPIGTALVAGGVASISFSPLASVGDLTVTVTAFNAVPFQGNVAVSPSSGPFVVGQSIEILEANGGGDGDGKPDFGEEMAVKIKLKNVGFLPAEAVSMTLTAVGSGLQMTDGEEIFGQIAEGESIERAAAFSFIVENDVADGQNANLKFHLSFSDTMGYDILLPLKFQAPKLEIGHLTIDDSGSGNGNGRLDGSETAFVRVGTSNLGKSASPPVVCKLKSGSPWLTITPGAAGFNIGKLAADGGSAEAFFTVKISPDAPLSEPVVFDCQAVAGTYQAEKSFPGHLLNAVVEDFESHDFNTFPWQMAGNKPWLVSVIEPFEGEYCARSGQIGHNQKSVLQLTLDVLEDGALRFARRVDCEPNYDFLKFRMDTTLVAAWSGNLGWEEFSFPVAAGEHTFSWTYEKDAFGTDGQDRAWLDALTLPPHRIIVSSKNPGVSQVQNLSVWPNPTSGEAVLSFQLLENQEVVFEIFDLLGHRVRTSDWSQRLETGGHWQFLDFGGLVSGVYFLQVRGERGAAVRKVVKI